MLLSVIIPVYKVEKTLDRCVESVLLQMDSDEMEVILVDDGSPDSCGEMCDRWALNDSCIKVIHKENGGLSSARNAGIDIATGEYITFVDSDDYLLPDTYNKLLQRINELNNISILEFGVIHEGSNRIPFNNIDAVYTSSRSYWLSTKAWNHSYAWNKIYRRQLFENVRFEEGKVFEDLLIMPLLLSKNPKVAITGINGYVYLENEEGISCKKSARKSRELLFAEIKAAYRMGTMPFGKGWDLYYLMFCRIYDIFRFTL